MNFGLFFNSGIGMQPRRLYKALCFVQGMYTLVTALWAIVDINSFMAITGPKTDTWLVKTVAVLLIPFAICFLLGVRSNTDGFLIIVLGLTSAMGLIFIDFYYSMNGTISRIYQADGVLQAIFFLLWIYILARSYRNG